MVIHHQYRKQATDAQNTGKVKKERAIWAWKRYIPFDIVKIILKQKKTQSRVKQDSRHLFPFRKKITLYHQQLPVCPSHDIVNHIQNPQKILTLSPDMVIIAYPPSKSKCRKDTKKWEVSLWEPDLPSHVSWPSIFSVIQWFFRKSSQPIRFLCLMYFSFCRIPMHRWPMQRSEPVVLYIVRSEHYLRSSGLIRCPHRVSAHH